MSLELYFSNRTDKLAQELADVLASVWQDPLRPPVLLIPNRHVEKWLKLFLSRRFGALVGMSGEFIESFLWRTLVAQGEISHGPALIDGPLLQQAILFVMHSVEASGGGELAALREYCAAGWEGGRVRRKTGLAARLANLFLEYEYARPDLHDHNGVLRFAGILGKWPESDYFSVNAPHARPMEQWQRVLYGLAMNAIRNSLGPHYVTLPGALASQGFCPDAIALRAGSGMQLSPVLVFGFSGMSLFHRQVLLCQSRVSDIHVFTLNPCSAFWEDVGRSGAAVTAAAGTRRTSGPKPALLFGKNSWELFGRGDPEESPIVYKEEPGENRLLYLWGHAGKENIALWCQAAEYRFNELYEEPVADTLLGDIQRAALFRLDKAPSPRSAEAGPDASLVVFDAPGEVREVETMRDYVLEAMRRDPALAPGDIGVYVADMARYRAALHEVLDAYPLGSTLHVPWRLADENAGSSLFCAAADGLLSLVKSEFSRGAVFSLLRNPLVSASRGASESDVGAWEQWALRLGVSHGFSREHRLALGEHDPASQHTWARAFERMLLSRVCEADVSFALTGNDPDDTVRPFAGWEIADPESCSNFIDTVESLYRHLRSIETQTTWTGAVRTFSEVLRNWTDCRGELTDEQRAADRYMEELSVLESRDRFGGAFDIEEFLLLASELAEFDVPVKSSYLAGALTVSAIRASRAIPHRIVYVLGLNEGSFPGDIEKDTLDLRTWNRVPGDLRQYRAAQYAFLELLTCAQERLVLSFCGRDKASGALLLPSSVVAELISFVNENIRGENGAFAPTRIPLLAEQENPARDARFPEKWLPPSYGKDIALLAWPGVADRGQALIRRQSPSRPAQPGVVCSIAQLRAFLHNPLESTLARGMDLGDRSDTPSDDDAEPFASDSLGRWQILKRFSDLACDTLFGTGDGPIAPVHHTVPSPATWSELLAAAYGNEIAEGAAPEGVFAEFDKLELFGEALGIARTLSRIAAEKSAARWLVVPSARLQSEDAKAVRPWVEISLPDNRPFRVCGGPFRVLVNPASPSERELLSVCVSRATVKNGEVCKRFNLVEPMLFSLASLAAGAGCRHSVLFVGFTEGTNDTLPVLWNVRADAAAARAYLVNLALAMEDPIRKFDHLPFEIIESITASGVGLDCAAVSRKLDENDESDFRKAYVSRLEALAIADKSIPPDPLCAAISAERFGILFSTEKTGAPHGP